MKIPVFMILCCLLTVLVTSPGIAQVPDYPSNGLLPVVPQLTTRQLGSQSDIDRLRNRNLDDSESIGSFIKSVQGEDATIKLVVGRGRLITLQEPLAALADSSIPVIAVGDPTVVDVDILPNPQMVRILGKRVGTTDISFVTANGKAFSFQLHVTYDMDYVQVYLRQAFPDAALKISAMNEHLIVEGQAKDTAQVQQILRMLNAYLSSAQVSKRVKDQSKTEPGRGDQPYADGNPADGNADPDASEAPGSVPSGQQKPDVSVTLVAPQIINLIHVPGVQQVVLRVRIAELNRTAFRQIGTDLFVQSGDGTTVGTQITGAMASLLGLNPAANATGFGVFPSGEVDMVTTALRNNQVLSILAEPNLTAMHGQQASFLAGGEFPVPVPQGGGGTNAVTIQYKKFGVQLDFVPYILDDDTIRLHVAPEVSTIDNSIGVTTLGTSVPGINTRRIKTSVELKQGQTLAVAGLLQVDLDGETRRIPGLGDVPYLGGFFSNTSHERVEKELLVLVTPYFVAPMEEHQIPALPGVNIKDPTDHELYWLQRIEGLTDCDYRATTGWNDPMGVLNRIRNESNNIHGPYGFSR